ncbi:hypothetical protein SMW93_003631 [Cronobacter sakazakii]|nr:hypothetical protein [Cronobacter sakazakii]ELY4752667.1 hypothetical protein [Cronobacter sakazakii]ELY5779464.1 hypothetical protein [Cronobacter sakazakii]
MDKSREQFEAYFIQYYLNDNPEMVELFLKRDGEGYKLPSPNDEWRVWQASRSAMTPACWRTYYPDTEEEAGRAHSESGPESCAKRIASEIGGYVVPVYYGEAQQCAAGLKVKGE